MKKSSGILWGLFLIVLGVFLALKSLGIADFGTFFRGWWALFIIIPGIIGFFNDKDKTVSIISIVIGVLLLLAARDIISYGVLWKMILSVILIIIGLKVIIRAAFGEKRMKMKHDG